MTAVLPDPAFLAYIDHHHLADKLLALHWQRVGVGVAGAILAVGYNAYRAPGTDGRCPRCRSGQLGIATCGKAGCR